jgi:hypothetical protein
MTQSTAHEINEERRLQEIEHTIKELSDKIDTLTQDVSDLVAAWKAANWVINFVKWAAGVSTAITILYMLATGKGIK